MRQVATILLLFASGCLLGPLDLLGRETTVTENENLHRDSDLEDDRIEDKHPVYDPDLTVTETFDWCQVELNKSGSVTKLDILPFEKDEAYLDGKLYRGRAEALVGLPADADAIPSMEVVNGHLKPFNDGLYAAVELAVQDGSAAAALDKHQLLRDLLAALEARLQTASAAQATTLEEAMIFVAAGLIAGGSSVSIRPDLEARAHAFVDGQPPLRLRPIGFYTWNAALEHVFAQDRLLQNVETISAPLAPFSAFAAIAVVLEEEPALLESYQTVLALYGGLTNPFVSYTPVDLLPYVDGLDSLADPAAVEVAFHSDHPGKPFVCTNAYWALFPASRSRDTEYYNSRWCDSSMPAGTTFIDELIAAVRRGEVDLSPAPDSGWYDYQLWALETLLIPERGPESDHLLLTKAYKKKLIETFKSLITQARETHVKQLDFADVKAAPLEPIDLYPQFPLEPFPTFYLRTARGYRLVATLLEGVLGAGFLGEARRLHEDGGRSSEGLGAELRRVVELSYGLYFLSAASVGLRAETYLLADELAEIDRDAAEESARAWLGSWRTDPDILKDPRVIVPIGADQAVVTYWATVGVKVFKVRAEFVEGYEPEVVESPCPIAGFVEHHYYLLSEQMVEVRLHRSAPPPTRAELRAICDRYDDASDIVRALEAL